MTNNKEVKTEIKDKFHMSVYLIIILLYHSLWNVVNYDIKELNYFYLKKGGSYHDPYKLQTKENVSFFVAVVLSDQELKITIYSVQNICKYISCLIFKDNFDDRESYFYTCKLRPECVNVR